MINLFIDTNILLSFFHYTSDDLEELQKLAALIQEGEIKLWLPDQLEQEFKRNRDAKIADALKHLSGQNLRLKFPQISKEYPEYIYLRYHQKEYEKLHAELISKVRNDAMQSKLQADVVVAQLFWLGEHISTTDQIIQKALLRANVGNPPGKKGSLGDAINWEALLADLNPDEDLCFVSEDKDFRSQIDENEFNPFLRNEWESPTRKLHFYRRLSAFFNDHFPHITLASEVEKDLLIQGLAHSENFATTHSLVGKLSKFSEFSEQQVQALIDAAIGNSQVSWILDDDDVFEFFQSCLAKEPKLLTDPENLLFAKDWGDACSSVKEHDDQD